MANKGNQTKKGKSGNKKMKHYLDDVEVSEEDFEHEKEECA